VESKPRFPLSNSPRYWSAINHQISVFVALGVCTRRLMVQGIKLFFFLFWLLFVFIGVSLLPSEPVAGVVSVIGSTIFFAKAAWMMHKGRQDALRKLGGAR
jgi:hypothetical protein